MSLSRCVNLRCLLNSNSKSNFISILGSRFKTKEIVVEKPPAPESIIEHPKFFDSDLDVRPRQRDLKEKIEPFAKKLFASEIDTDILAYPEVLDKDDLLNLDDKLDKIDTVIGDMGASDDSILQIFKQQRIFDSPLSVFQGGLESNYTEQMRILEEIARFRPLVAQKLNSQWSGIETMKHSFTQESMNTLSNQLSSGRNPIRILHKERISNDVDVPDMRILAKLDPNGVWRLNGEKFLSESWEHSPQNEHLIVLSCIHLNILQGFLVHPNAPGVTYNDSTVTFSDTPATMLGENMFNTLDKLMESEDRSQPYPTTPIYRGLTHMRLGDAAIALGLLKEAVTYVLGAVKGKYFSKREFSSLPLFENTLTDAVTAVYKIESMIYLTTGLEDGYMDPDTEIEAILCRTYATKEAVRVLNNFLSDLTPYHLEGDLEAYLQAARNILYREHNEHLAVYSALSGMKAAGYTLQDKIKKLRNPAFHPIFALKMALSERRQMKDNPVLDLHLKEYFHPSLQDAADHLEYCVLRIAYVVQEAFVHHGHEIVHEHRDLLRIHQIVSEVYGAIASLARGSRSYCIGVSNSDKEILQCFLIALNTRFAIQKNVEDVINGKYVNNDDCIHNIAKTAVKMRKPPGEHPLTRVFF